MKKISKILALVLALSVVTASFAACGGDSNTGSGEKLTYWAIMQSHTSQSMQSLNEHMMYQEVCKATGIDVEFMSPAAGSTGSEAFQILLASNPGDYPDMIEYNWSSYPGGPDQAIDDGVIANLNEYIKDNAPNFYDYMEGEKGEANGNVYKAQSISSNGNYYGFTSLVIGPYKGFGGIAIRKDLLDKWGLDVPVTIDDWENVFETAQQNGIKYPFTDGGKRLTFGNGYEMFNTAWEVGAGFYLDNDTVKFGPFEKKYKDYLAKMTEWVKKGYIDPDFPTNDPTTFEGYMTNDTSIAAYTFIGSGIGKLLAAMEERNPSYNLVACPFPVLNEGDTPWFQNLGNDVKPSSTAISANCFEKGGNRYKDAMKWCDYFYSEEGMILKQFGIEGDTFTIEEKEDGKHYVYTDKILDHEKLGFHSVEASLYHFMRPGDGIGLCDHADYLEGYYPYPSQKEALAIWNSNVEEARKHILPKLNYTAEESTLRAEIRAKAHSELDAAITNIMLGKASIDTLDAAIKKAKDAGYDKLIEIDQAAYDRYREAL